MLPGRLKLQLIIFLLLSGGVAANLFLLQQSARTPITEGVLKPQSYFAEHAGAGGRATGSLGAAIEGEFNTRTKPRYAIEAIQQSNEKRADSGRISQTYSDPFELTRAVQRELNRGGYESGPADGVVGPVTRAAIMAFEYDHGLALTALPSNTLLRQILLGSAAANAARGAGVRVQSAEAKALIRSVQVSISRLGYQPGPINGQLGPSTARAIRKFELDQGLTSSGRISGPLISRLARIAAKRRVASGR